jgi:hypothetical protein
MEGEDDEEDFEQKETKEEVDINRDGSGEDDTREVYGAEDQDEQKSVEGNEEMENATSEENAFIWNYEAKPHEV